MNIIKLLQNNELFSNFSESEINSIFDCLQGKISKHPRAKIITQVGDPVETISIILEGLVMKYIIKPNGVKEPLTTLGASEMYGLVEGYLKPNITEYAVAVAEEATILNINIASIVGQCSKTCSFHQKLINNVLSSIANLCNNLSRDTEFLIIKSMRHKIAKLILEKHEEQQTLSINLGINRNEMAEYLNVSRPSMSREMMRMRDEGLFNFQKEKIEIEDIERLKHIIKELS